MKIGILTFHFANNYGAVLQAYALKEKLQDIGRNKVEIINYANDKLKSDYSINPFKDKRIKGILKNLLYLPIKYSQAGIFEKFRREYLCISNKTTNTFQIDRFDTIIVGSDQVWNTNITYGDLNYFLPNICYSNIQSFAYAASSSDEFVPPEIELKVGGYLQNFNNISVREEQLQQLLKNRYGISSKIVLDPVFLFDKYYWNCLATKCSFSKYKYALVYMLEYNENLDNFIKLIEAENGLKIYTIHPTGNKMIKSGKFLKKIGPIEFVGLVRDAQLIISNSFHAFAFSYIFEKKIYFECVEGASNRINNIINLLDIKITKEDKEVFLADMTIKNEEAYKEMLNQSMDFLYEICDSRFSKS